MVSTLLFYKILQLFAVMLIGFLLVKFKVVKSEDSSVLSKLCLYLLMPAAVVNAYNIKGLNREILGGLAIALVASVIIHLFFLGADYVYKKAFHLSGVERATVYYSNAGNLVIPIVTSILGPEWVIYSTAYISVQLVFIWSHGVSLFKSGQKTNFKKVIFNPSIVAIIIGIVLLVFGIKLPGGVSNVISSLGGMVGDIGMLIAGMLMADVNFKKLLSNKRLYFVAALRMIAAPLIVLLILKIIIMFDFVSSSQRVLMVTFLSAITPTAASILQFAQIYDDDVDFAVGMNTLTTLVCIGTMPLLLALFEL